jgi:hypothetical protein
MVTMMMTVGRCRQPLVTTACDGLNNISHGRLDKKMEEMRQLWCGVVARGVCGYERGAKSVAGVVARCMKREARPSW